MLDVSLAENTVCVAGSPKDDFDPIRQLISPVAEDTKKFLEQISL